MKIANRKQNSLERQKNVHVLLLAPSSKNILCLTRAVAAEVICPLSAVYF